MKKIGFLSFGHWTPSPQSQTRSASDALLQSIDLAVAAEELGADGAYFRVHHFARQLGSPFPLLAAVGARTKRIEIGTAVIDMRYENPLYMAEDAGAADLIAGGRLQLGISRGSPEQVIDGWRYFGYAPPEGKTDADMAPAPHRGLSRSAARRGLRASPTRGRCSRTRPACCASSPTRRACASASGGAPAPTPPRHWAAKLGMNLQSSTLKIDESGRAVPCPAGGADPALPRGVEGGRPCARRGCRSAAASSRSWTTATARISDAATTTTTRSAISTNRRAPSSAAATPPSRTSSIEQLKKDEAIAEADTLLLTVPNQLGVDYNAHVIEAILKHVAPGLGWR